LIDDENPEWTAADVASTSPSTRAANVYWFAPVGIKLARFALQALLRGQKTVDV